MAKGQRRGNREARKPKAPKPTLVPPTSPFAVKNAPAVTNAPKRNG